MKNRIVEWVKSLLIVVLALNALFLIVRLSLSENRAASAADVAAAMRQAVSTREPADEKTSAASAATPVSMAFTGENGRCGMVDRTQIDSCYSRVMPLIAEALGSAEAMRETDCARWQEALCGCGIYLSFDCAISVDMLAGWSGGSSEEHFFADRYILLVDSDNTVCVLCSDREAYLASPTSASASAVREVIDSARPNDAKFAFELAEGQSRWENIDPCSLIVEGMNENLPVYLQETCSKTDISTSVMEALELNPYMDTGYTDQDGWDTYLFSVGTLRLSGDGKAIFRAAGEASVAALTMSNTDFAQEAVEMTRSFVQRTVLPYCGEADVGLSSIVQEGDRIEIGFSYYLNGHRVIGLEAAKFIIQKGKTVEVQLDWQHFAQSGTVTSLLAPRLECAVYPQEPCCAMEIGYSAGDPLWLMEE